MLSPVLCWPRKSPDGKFPDPYFGMNLRQIPGTSYPVGHIFSNLPMAAGQPIPLWLVYRNEFSAPAASQKEGAILAALRGINYRRRNLAERPQNRGFDTGRRSLSQPMTSM